MKNRLFARIRYKAYRIINPIYTKTFGSCQASLLTNLDSSDLIRQSTVFNGLNSRLNYFIFHASYGDKWCILSFLGAHLELYPSSRIIANRDDKPLIRLFLSDMVIEEKFVFTDESSLLLLSSYFRPVSRLSTQIVDSWCAPDCQHTITPFLINHGLPPGTVRHLHAVYYPYFNELINLHGVTYGTLIKTVLYLPADISPSYPCYYSQDDYQAATAICKGSCFEREDSFILINAINFSHSSLSAAHLSIIIASCLDLGYRVLVNQTQVRDNSVFIAIKRRFPMVELITVPSQLLSLVSDCAEAIIGVVGGAMGIAVQFSSSHVLSLQTKALGSGVPDHKLYGKWGKQKIWHWIDQDWPCLSPKRVVENAYLGDVQQINDDDLRKLILSFLGRVKLTKDSL